MATLKACTKPLKQVVPSTATERDSLGEAINQFLLWEMRSRDCIKLKRCYIDAAQDLEAGVLLSQIIYWHLPDKEGEQKLTVQRDGHWWLAKARFDWWDECRLTPKQFDRAIRHLEKQQLVATKVYKWHSTNIKHIRVDWGGLLQALSMLDANAEKVVGFRRRELTQNAYTPPGNSSKGINSKLTNSQSSEFPNSQSSGFPNSQSLDSQIGNLRIPYQVISELPNREIHYIDPEITSKTTCKDYSSPLTPQGEQESVKQLEKSFTCSQQSDHLPDVPSQLEVLPGKEACPHLLDVPPQSNQAEKVANQTCSNTPFFPPSKLPRSEIQSPQTANSQRLETPTSTPRPSEVADPKAEVVDSGKASADSSKHTVPLRHSHNRFRRNQPQLPKNIDGSDQLAWETEHRGKFDPEFEKWMARSLMQYPAFQKLMAGELQIKVRKHISAGKYDFKRRDELFIEWEAMQSGINTGEGTYGITAKAVSRRAKIRSALCS